MSVEKVKQIAREKYGKELTDEQAAKYAEKYGKLTDSEIDSVTGGYSCTEIEFWEGKFCEPCGVWCDPDTVMLSGWKCPVCGTVYR